MYFKQRKVYVLKKYLKGKKGISKLDCRIDIQYPAVSRERLL